MIDELLELALQLDAEDNLQAPIELSAEEIAAPIRAIRGPRESIKMH